MAIPVTSSSSLLKLIRRADLIETPTLDAFLNESPRPLHDPHALAKQMRDAGLLTSFQVKHLLMGRQRGLVLGAYRLLEPIGKGGTGQVYLAEQRDSKERVAIKVLAPHRSEDRDCLERFYREARAAALLDHPNIVRAYEVARQDNIHYLVLEYAQGPSLAEVVEERGPIPFAEAVGYIGQALTGLEHAYERGLIHRDIKPANLVLDKSGTVKILDMGLALFFDDADGQLTQNLSRGAVLGTADYLSPEQAINCHEVDIRTDIYSLGATFFTLLNGQPPFHGSKLTQKLIDHQIKEPPPIHELQPRVPRELADIVSKMMAKRPEDRFQTPAEARAALAPWLGGSVAIAPAVPATAPKASRGDLQRSQLRALIMERLEQQKAQLKQAEQRKAVPCSAEPRIDSTLHVEPIVDAAPPRRRSLLWLWAICLLLGVTGTGAWMVMRP